MFVVTRSKITKIIIGILFIVLGALWLIEATGIFDFEVNLFFDGWWAVLCMVIFLISIVSDGPNFGNILCFCIFLVLFLDAQEWIPVDINIWLLLFAVIVLFIGGKIVLSAFRKPQVRITSENSFSGTATQVGDEVNRTHTKYVFTGENVCFSGVTVGNISYEISFGSLTLDFTGATFTENSYLSVNTNFGETKIILPAGVKADVMKDVAFGSVKDISVGTTPVRMKLDCAFGAITVKNA